MAQLIQSEDMDPEVLHSSRELLQNVDIANVRLSSFSAMRHEGSGRPVRASVEFEPQYASEMGVYANKFDWTVTVTGEGEESVAEIKATFFVEYRVTEGFLPDPGAANHVAKTTGLLAVYPYAREFIESATARLQLDPLVLGLIRTSDMRPRSVSAVAANKAVPEIPTGED